MTDTTCKRAACNVVSPLIAGHPTFCSPDCEAIHAAVYADAPPAEFPWLGPAPHRSRETPSRPA